MDSVADKEHIKANCPPQSDFFRKVILKQLPHSTVDLYQTYINKFSKPKLSEYDAFFWTGGLGNIYQKNEFNISQLKVCEDVLSLNKPIWCSCWGLQVLVFACGGKISKSKNPEFGFSSNISIKLENYIFKGKPDSFTAPGHHYDIIESMPTNFNILAENNVSIQAIVSKDSNIVCTQYHPELPFDFIGKLMLYWKKNYLKEMSENKFIELIDELKLLESENRFQRELELTNWINNL